MDFFSILKSSKLPQNEIEILLAFLLNKERVFFMTHPEIKIEKAVYSKFKALEKKRLENWSIAVLTRHKEFYGLDFKVDKNVLVPRPESELIVDEILELSKKTEKDILIIDLGTGSGAIIISCAVELEKLNNKKYKITSFSAVDISSSALKIAKINSLLHKQNTKIKFFEGDLLKPLISRKYFSKPTNSELIISANLPYLTQAQIKGSPSIQKEPRLALVAGNDGLKYYRHLFKELKNLKVTATILCEIDASQSINIKLLTKKIFPQASLKIKKDLAGLDRLVIIKI